MRAARVILKVMVFSLIGAAVSAAVGWSSAMWELPRPQTSGNISFEESREIFAARIRPGQYADRLAETAAWPPDFEAMGLDASPGAAPIYLIQGTRSQGRGHRFTSVTDHLRPVSPHVVEFEAGWPLRCLRGTRWNDRGVGHEEGLKVLPARWRWLVPGSAGLRLVPFHPMWPGLIVNTLLYGLIAWQLARAPGVLRRRFRIRRERCVGCGYDLRGGREGAVCPECGSPGPRSGPAIG